MSLRLRPLTANDGALLRGYLYEALFVPDGAPPLPRETIDRPEVARYVDGWGRPGDAGWLALEGSSGADVGAAWLRLWQAHETGYGFVDLDTPELSVAVRPDWRGRGVGTQLLERLVREADQRHGAISLSVSKANPAVRLYRRLGFEVHAEPGDSLTMRRARAG